MPLTPPRKAYRTTVCLPSCRYISKPEPYGTLVDNEALRQRDGNVAPQARFLQARVVGAPEAVYRALGYHLRSSAPVVHLSTNPPERRMRSLLRHTERERKRKQRDGEELQDSDYELRFADGAEQLYAKRPQNFTFEPMLYGDFHSRYEVRRHDKLTKSQLERGHGFGWWLLLGEPSLDELSEEDTKKVRCVVERPEPKAIAVAWRLPDKHGPLYFYQKLMLNCPWRDCTPTAFLTADNPRGSLEEQCRITRRPLRDGSPGETILPDGDLAEIARHEAEARLFSPEQVKAIVERATEHQETMDAMLHLMEDDDGGGAGDDGGHATAALGDLAPDDGSTATDLQADARRMVDEIAQARGAPAFMPRPILTPTADGGLSWSDTNRPGASGLTFVLKPKQVEAFTLLKQASTKQIHAFLSGEGGMGKSTLINLLVQLWRSDRKRVIVTAASAKAARLIGGFTVHSAFWLQMHGRFCAAQTVAKKNTDHYIWLLTADIILIDEISMLTAGALSGVDHALAFVRSSATSIISPRGEPFGGKSVVVLGGESPKFHARLASSNI